MPKSIFSKWLKKAGACKEARKWVKKNNITSVIEAWEKCEIPDWMIWLLDEMGVCSNQTNIYDIIGTNNSLVPDKDLCDKIREEFKVDNDTERMRLLTLCEFLRR